MRRFTFNNTSSVCKSRHLLVDCKGNSQLRAPFACLIDANSSRFDKTVYYTVLRIQNSSLKGKAENGVRSDRKSERILLYYLYLPAYGRYSVGGVMPIPVRTRRRSFGIEANSCSVRRIRNTPVPSGVFLPEITHIR